MKKIGLILVIISLIIFLTIILYECYLIDITLAIIAFAGFLLITGILLIQ